LYQIKDFESNSNELIVSFSKNGVDMGVAYTIKKNDLVKDKNGKSVFYPHILSKNIVFEVNFGQRVSLLGDEPFAPLKSGFELMQKYSLDKRVRGELAPKEKKDCEVIMVVGLPGTNQVFSMNRLN
jgi:heterogeneous nuclear ribonucleoprotein U